MLRKRLIGTITIKDGWAVQSFGYNRYLPLGKPECIAENLDRWSVDEILLQVIDRSKNKLGPDIELIERVARSKINTPLIYAGGIHNEEQAAQVIRSGADRICIDAVLATHPDQPERIAHRLGAQALIATFPLSISNGKLMHYNHLTQQTNEFCQTTRQRLEDGFFSEAMLIDYQHEGYPEAFDFRLTDFFTETDTPLILFGGLSSAEMLEQAFSYPSVSAVAVGHFLTYKEHAVQKLKQGLSAVPMRSAHYHEQELD